ncbi:unnamed protein product [Dovyalis caffra]|uniref:Uncharacterized protein n=1 Tax=Dovyalis caffra TaxID=77055 RepID=A0AAV1SKT3_9ROSI|nr:unnamed protein product [Dovyalis caffra]
MNCTRGTHNTGNSRRRRKTTVSGRRKYGTPTPTPFLHWKFLQDDSKSRHSAASGSGGSGGSGGAAGGQRGGDGVGGCGVAVSARTLAAGLWKLGFVGGGGGDKGLNLKYVKTDELGLEPDVGQVNTVFPSHHISSEHGAEKMDLLQTPEFVSNLKHGILCKGSLDPLKMSEYIYAGQLFLDHK